MVQSFDAAGMVEGLCEKLDDTDFADCSDDDELLADIGDLITEHVDAELGELASVWVKGRDRGKVKPVWAYGADFGPDIAIEVADLPTIAIEVALADRENGTGQAVAEAIGRALVYSVQYSYAIVFVLDRASSDLHKHWFDSEIEARLWDNHRISLIVRA